MTQSVVVAVREGQGTKWLHRLFLLTTRYFSALYSNLTDFLTKLSILVQARVLKFLLRRVISWKKKSHFAIIYKFRKPWILWFLPISHLKGWNRIMVFPLARLLPWNLQKMLRPYVGALGSKSDEFIWLLIFGHQATSVFACPSTKQFCFQSWRKVAHY